ncbi:MAG: hypothetical protein AMS15_01590 [Planctomycetes bacterium DG_23]|nr:MAG: hypothetical protein AMS15_01590 [Planctomycetes bacterium DG_23]
MPEPQKIEKVLSHYATRTLLRHITTANHRGHTFLEEIFENYDEPSLGPLKRVKYALPFFIADFLRRKAGASRDILRDEIFRHPARAHGLINTAKAIGLFGLTKPQTFYAPLLVVWNFTQACNLNCMHCYQDARRPLPDELTLKEKLRMLDIFKKNYVPLLAFSGGEPMLSSDFWEVVERAGAMKFNISIATNGSLLTKEAAKRMRDINVRYVEVSLDSVHPEKHDRFRGGTGLWQRAVAGIKAALTQRHRGLKVGIASTITRLNFAELEDLILFAEDLGVDTFFAFNFIPTGRASDLARLDLTPQMRQEMLEILHKHLTRAKINIVSSAPQLARLCLARGLDGLMTTGHYGVGPGLNAKILAKYIGGCGAGRVYMALQPNGAVTPCVFMPIEVGNLRHQSLQDLWHNSPVFKILRDRDERLGHCRICEYKYHCGGCRAKAWAYFSDLRAPDPGCIHNLSAWQDMWAGKELKESQKRTLAAALQPARAAN